MKKLLFISLILCAGCNTPKVSKFEPSLPLPQNTIFTITQPYESEARSMVLALPTTGFQVVKAAWDYSTNSASRWPSASQVEIKTNLTDSKWTIYRTITFTNGMTNYSCVITGAFSSGFVRVGAI